MTIESGEITAFMAAIGAIATAIGTALWKGLKMIMDATKEAQSAHDAQMAKMIEIQAQDRKEAMQVIAGNTLSNERQASATHELTKAVERLTGRVETVERVVSSTDTKRFPRIAAMD
jgi:chaperonin cofactor prefoldin